MLPSFSPAVNNLVLRSEVIVVSGIAFHTFRRTPLPPATVAMVSVGGGAFGDLNTSYCMLRVGFILVCCRFLNVICSYMSLNIVLVVSRFSANRDHHRPPLPWWQVVVVKYNAHRAGDRLKSDKSI